MPLTVDDLAEHLNSDPPEEGSQRQRELQQALDSAVQEVRRMTGMVDGGPVTLRVPARPGSTRLLLGAVRLAAVLSVTDPGGLPVAPLYADELAGIIDLPVPASGGAWSVVVMGAPWPAALNWAALDWATHLYDTQRTVTSPVSDPDQPAPTFALPNRVAELLEPYRLPGAA